MPHPHFRGRCGDESEVAKLLERIRAELPPLAGVAHLAGVLDTRSSPTSSPATRSTPFPVGLPSRSDSKDRP